MNMIASSHIWKKLFSYARALCKKCNADEKTKSKVNIGQDCVVPINIHTPHGRDLSYDPPLLWIFQNWPHDITDIFGIDH